MGDEADALWDADLIEAGREDTREHYRQAIEKAVRTSPFRNRKPRRTSPLSRPERDMPTDLSDGLPHLNRNE